MSLPVENYCNQLWPPIYEQYYGADQAQEFPFYDRSVRAHGGRVLELGCGTGLLFFTLLRRGVDVYGIDVSPSMLEVLGRKAAAGERAEVGRRIRCQDMTRLELDGRFDQIFIPARAFLHAASLEAQLETLRRVRAHLAPGGLLLLNFFVPDPGQILAALQSPRFEPFDRYTHPLSGAPIELQIRRAVPDLSAQRFEVTWRFVQPGRVDETRMDLRWVHRDEFTLMLRQVGFSAWEVFADAEGGSFGPAATEMFWRVQR